MRYGYDDYDDIEYKQMKALNALRPQYRKWVEDAIREEDYDSGMDMDEALYAAYDMQQADEHHYEELYKKLKPEFQKVADKLMDEGWDEFKAIDEAFEQEYIEHVMYEEEKKKPPMSREEKYPGVIFTPRVKISSICEDDDIAF